jgi:hypothetical protein
VLELDPINRSVPTTISKITATITAYSAMSWPSSDQSVTCVLMTNLSNCKRRERHRTTTSEKGSAKVLCPILPQVGKNPGAAPFPAPQGEQVHVIQVVCTVLGPALAQKATQKKRKRSNKRRRTGSGSLAWTFRNIPRNMKLNDSSCCWNHELSNEATLDENWGCPIVECNFLQIHLRHDLQ